MPSPHFAAAEAVRDLINAQAWDAAYEFTATAVRHPKFKREDFKTLFVQAIPAVDGTYSMSPLDRGSHTVECPVNVVVAQIVDRNDTARVSQLEDLVYDIARLLARTSLATYGLPTEDLAVVMEDEAWKEDGVFFAGVGLVYDYRQLRV
jgi:hypothetical protein